MPLTRRAALFGLVAGLTGCAASPVISGSPAVAPSSPPPTQSADVAAAVTAVATLRATITAAAAVPGFSATGWAGPAADQCAAHLRLLSMQDPFGADDHTPFPIPTPTAPVVDTADAGVAALKGAIAAAVKALDATAAGSAAGDLRLLYASAATATSAISNQTLAPVADGPAPVRLQATTVEASLPIALGHAWALVYGLGVGIGRLGSKDPLHALGSARLPIVKGLRNELRAAIKGEPPDEPAAFTLPNAMSTPAEIGAAWAVLEANLLDGYARLVAASDDAHWAKAMRGQVGPVQAVGGRLGFWPGWVA